MKKVLCLLLTVTLLMGVLSSCMFGKSTKKEEKFCNLVEETQSLLDIVADDIYQNWYDCIYNDEFGEDINTAIAMAELDNSENLQTIETNTETIKQLYKEIPESSDLKSEVKAVMQAYNDYYTLVVEVSGSFKSYSADKETYKKELSSAVKNLSFELE